MGYSLLNRVGRAAVCAAALVGMAAAAQAEIYTRVAMLTGMAEVPANASPALGYARCQIDTVANTLTYRMVYTGLTAAETAAHIHGMSDPGVNSGVVHPLPAGPIKIGVWNYAEAQEADILNGRTYFNVHSAAFPGGEIRGQIVSAVAMLTGDQEVPPVATGGRGFGLFNIDTDTNTLRYYINYGGLGSAETAAHIHGFAPHTVSAGVLVGLPAGSPKIGTWTYTDAQEQAIIDGMTYVNIHTVGNPGGEIRGQVVFHVNTIDATQEVPANATLGNGGVLVSIDRVNDRMGFEIRRDGLTGAETAAHIHGFAPAGVNAGVLFGLPAGTPKRGLWVFGAANEAAVLDSRTYVNCHTAAFPGGEIRGQIIMGQYFPCSPLVTTHPSNTTVTSGSPASFTVVADPRGGGGPAYQWRRNGTALGNVAPFSGVNTATLSISAATSTEAGTYDCVVSNPCGGMASNTAELVIDTGTTCGTADFDGDGDVGTDADIEAFFACLAGNCCATCFAGGADFNGDGDVGTDADIEAFFRVLAGGPC